MTRRKRNRRQPHRSRNRNRNRGQSLWCAFSIDRDNHTVYVVAVHENTEESILRVAKTRHPEMPAIAVDLENVHKDLIKARLAEVDIIGVDADQVSATIVDIVLSLVVDSVVDQPGREECTHFCDVLFGRIPILRLSERDQDRFARHFMACEFCNDIALINAENLKGVIKTTPAMESEINRLAKECIDRVMEEDHDL